MNYQVLKVAVILLLLTSCFVQSPKYTSLEQVKSLKVGMTKVEVEEMLGIQPYDIKASTDSSKVFIYVYRVIDRKTLSFNTKKTNGRKVIGKYVQLEVAYSNDNKLTSMESCNKCPDNLVTKSRIDFEKIFVFVTVTLPVVLLYIGLKI